MSCERLTLATLNVRNISHNLVGVIDACQDANVDIIFLCETYHKRGHLPCAWTQYHNYAARGDGDSHFVKFGLSFLVRPQFPYEVHQVSTIHGEVLTLKVGPYTLHGVYLPPTLPAEEVEARYRLMSVDPFTIVLGDLNTRMGSLTGDS